MPDPSPTPIVEVRGLRRTFGDLNAVDGVDLTVAEGEFLSFLGPSGCGKTTLLRMIAGFERPDEGTIHLAGADITHVRPERRPLNMVFQRYALFPHLTVHDNIGFGLRLKGVARSEITRRVTSMLHLIELPQLAERYPHEISGGQAQRVALARALANDPKVLLLDEPLTALDRAVRGTMQEELKRIQAEVGTTFIYVTHDQEEAMSMSSRVALMNGGRIVQLCAPQELYRKPHSRFAADFIGDTNLLRCHVDASGGVVVSAIGQPVPGLEAAGASGELLVLIRPEDIRIDGADNGTGAMRGAVSASSFHGFYWVHHVRVGEQELTVREIAPDPTARVGESVALSFEPNRAVLLSA